MKINGDQIKGGDLISFWVEDGGLDYCGVAWVMQSVTYSFESNAFSEPVPEIRINGLTGLLTNRKGSSLMIAVELDAGSYSGNGADWWVLGTTPTGEWYYFDYTNSVWRYAGSLDDVSPTYQGTLSDLALLELYTLETSNLSEANYTLYFGVDTIRNGLIDYDRVYYDSLILNPIP